MLAALAERSLTAPELSRYRNLVETMQPWRHLFAGKRVLDYGASWGTSTYALFDLGASAVVGVDIDADRIAEGRRQLAKTTLPVDLFAVPDTRQLPFANGEFAVVLANAVVEHIPQPRDQHLREVWRVVAPGGFLVVNETPNSIFPKEMHTTDLWFNHWLPKSWAYRRAVRRGRFDPSRTDWDSSGWRGAHYWEVRRNLAGAMLIPETVRLRHRIFTRLGLPASCLDPYSTWIFRKPPKSA
jgi:SAM-dependent methyltransferase